MDTTLRNPGASPLSEMRRNRKAGLLGEALAIFDNAIGSVTDPCDQSRYHEEKARTLIAADRKGEAGHVFQTALRLDPENDSARTSYGLFLLKQRKFDAAREQYDYVLAGDPQNAHARFGIAKLAFAQGQQC